MITIGTCAYPGSGQDVLADAISKRYGIEKYSISQSIKEIAVDNNIIPTRENLQKLRKDYDRNFGREYFPNLITNKIKEMNKNVIITGLRRKEEFEIFKKSLDIYVIFIHADFEIRAQRVINRGEVKDPKTVAEFKLQEQKEAELFDIAYLRENANFIFDCSREWDYYESNLESLIFQIPIFQNL